MRNPPSLRIGGRPESSRKISKYCARMRFSKVESLALSLVAGVEASAPIISTQVTAQYDWKVLSSTISATTNSST